MRHHAIPFWHSTSRGSQNMLMTRSNVKRSTKQDEAHDRHMCHQTTWYLTSCVDFIHLAVDARRDD